MLFIANSCAESEVLSPSTLRTVVASFVTVPRTCSLLDAEPFASATTFPVTGWAAFTESS